MLAGDLSWVPPGVDTGKASIARVYDYWLGGTHNFQADRDAARALIAVGPGVRAVARENRAFLARAVRFLAQAGIRQFLDIGSGIPTQGNVHEIAQDADAAAKVAYVDIDPVAVAHSRAILGRSQTTAVLEADLRDPGKITGDPGVRRLIDFAQPVGLLLVSVLHFVTDEEDPWQLVTRFSQAIPPGSYLVISHGTSPEDVKETYQDAYKRSVAGQSTLRSRAGIERFFAGFELVAPGLVAPSAWRRDPGDAAAEPGQVLMVAGVGRKL